MFTYDEAALFRSYAAPTRRALIDRITRGLPYIDEEDSELCEIAKSLKYKVKAMSNTEYQELYKNPPESGF